MVKAFVRAVMKSHRRWRQLNSCNGDHFTLLIKIGIIYKQGTILHTIHSLFPKIVSLKGETK